MVLYSGHQEVPCLQDSNVCLTSAIPGKSNCIFPCFLLPRRSGQGIFSGYFHQSQIKVRVGEIVQEHQLIGLIGATGRVTGPHLHFEIWVNGVQVNPLDWFENEYP